MSEVWSLQDDVNVLAWPSDFSGCTAEEAAGLVVCQMCRQVDRQMYSPLKPLACSLNCVSPVLIHQRSR